MANPSSSTSTPMPSSLGLPVSEKLTRENYMLWKAQVLPTIRGAQLVGFLEGTTLAPMMTITISKEDKSTEMVPNPAYTALLAQDQQVLSYLLSTMTREVLVQMVTMTSAAEVWAAARTMYSSQSRARVVHLRNKLSTTRKGEMNCATYFAKMKSYADEMAAAGKRLDEDDVVSYILSGLDVEFNPFVESVCGRADPISLSDLYAQLLTAEARIETQNQQQYMFVNSASRGGPGNRGRGGRGRTGSRGDGIGRGQGGRGGSSGSKLTCQLCGKTGHTVHRCYKRFDASFTGDEKLASVATTSYGVDTNWYTDTGATDHITSELDKLTTREKYNGNDQVHTANGAGSSSEDDSSARKM